MQLTYYLKYLFDFSDKMGQNYTTSSYKELWLDIKGPIVQFG